MTIDRLKQLANAACSNPIQERRPRLREFENIETPYYGMLWEVAHELGRVNDGIRVVELGCYTGVSACVLADGLCRAGGVENGDGYRGEVITVDIDLQPIALSRVKRWPNILAIQKHAHWVPRVIPFIGQPWIDLLYIDSHHSYNQAKGELDLFLPMVKPGGVILYDDVDLDDEMRRFWAEVPEPKAQDRRLHPTSGFGFSVKA